MPIPFGIALQLNQLPVLGLVVEASATAPSTPSPGRLWLDTSVSPNKLKWWNNTAWIAADHVLALARANHTGTQLAATISDFNTAVRTNSLDQLTVAAADVSLNSHKITNLAAPTGANDAARLTDLQVAQAGIDNKASVRAATTANVAIATGLANGQVVDGVTLATGDRVLVKNQTTATENGLYTAPASGAASRTTDTLTANSFVFVEEGTSLAETQWMVSNNGAIVIGTTAIAWTQFGAPGGVSAGTGITVVGSTVSLTAPVTLALGGTNATTAAGARTSLSVPGKFVQVMGALGAGASTNVVHNLGNQNLQVAFKDATTLDGDLVLGWDYVDNNTISVQNDLAYAASRIEVTVLG